MKLILVVGLFLGAGTAAWAAKSAPSVIKVVGKTSAKIFVDGKAYVPGTPLKPDSKITVTGPVTLKIGDATLRFTGETSFIVSKDLNLKVFYGQVEVEKDGHTAMVAKGQTASLASENPNSSASSGSDAEEEKTDEGKTDEKKSDKGESTSEGDELGGNLPLPPPPPNPQQDNQTVSPSSP